MTAFMLIMGITIGLIVIYAAVMPILLEQQQAKADAHRFAYQRDEHDFQFQYELLLQSIVDLDFDYDMGKLSDAVYAEQRKMLLGRSVYILKKLDTIHEEAEHHVDDVDAQIEAMIAAQREQNAVDEIDAQIEAEIAARREKVAL